MSNSLGRIIFNKYLRSWSSGNEAWVIAFIFNNIQLSYSVYFPPELFIVLRQQKAGFCVTGSDYVIQ